MQNSEKTKILQEKEKQKVAIKEKFEQSLQILERTSKEKYIEFFYSMLRPYLEDFKKYNPEKLDKQLIELEQDDTIQQLTKCITVSNYLAHSYEYKDNYLSRYDYLISYFYNLKGVMIHQLFNELDKDNRTKYPSWGFDDDNRFFIDVTGYGQCNWHIHKLNIDSNYKAKNIFSNKRSYIPNTEALGLDESQKSWCNNQNNDKTRYNNFVKTGDWEGLEEYNKHKYTYNCTQINNLMSITDEASIEKYDKTKHTMQKGQTMLSIMVLPNNNSYTINIFALDSYKQRAGIVNPQHVIENKSKEKPVVFNMSNVYKKLLEIPNVDENKLRQMPQERILKILAMGINKNKEYIIPVSCQVRNNQENIEKNKDDQTYVGGNTGTVKIAIIRGKNRSVEYKDFDVKFEQPLMQHQVLKAESGKENIKEIACTR